MFDFLLMKLLKISDGNLHGRYDLLKIAPAGVKTDVPHIKSILRMM